MYEHKQKNATSFSSSARGMNAENRCGETLNAGQAIFPRAGGTLYGATHYNRD